MLPEQLKVALIPLCLLISVILVYSASSLFKFDLVLRTLLANREI